MTHRRTCLWTLAALTAVGCSLWGAVPVPPAGTSQGDASGSAPGERPSLAAHAGFADGTGKPPVATREGIHDSAAGSIDARAAEARRFLDLERRMASASALDRRDALAELSTGATEGARLLLARAYASSVDEAERGAIRSALAATRGRRAR